MQITFAEKWCKIFSLTDGGMLKRVDSAWERKYLLLTSFLFFNIVTFPNNAVGPLIFPIIYTSSLNDFSTLRFVSAVVFFIPRKPFLLIPEQEMITWS